MMALIALLIVTSIGLSMMFMADTETIVNGNYRDEQTAYYASKAGLEEVRDRMRSNAGSGITISASLPTARPGAVSGVLYILNPTGSETVAPWLTSNTYFDNEVCREVNCSGGQVPPTAGWYVTPTISASTTYAASPRMPYKWIRVTLKTNRSASGWSGSTQNFMYVDGKSANANYYVCWNGTNELTQAVNCSYNNQYVYMLTSLAVTLGGTRRMVQTELAHDPGTPVNVPAAISIDSTGQSQCQIQGDNNLMVSGVDEVSPPSGVAGIAINNGSCQSQGGNIVGGTGWTQNPSVYNVAMPPAWTPGTGLSGTITNLENQADCTGTFSTCTNYGTYSTCPADYRTTVIKNAGSTVNGITGCGILVFEAGGQTQLEINGNIQWKGLIIVYSAGGQVQVQMDSGGGKIEGALMMASNSGSQIQFQYQNNGPAGGMLYDSAYLNPSVSSKPLRIVASREMMY